MREHNSVTMADHVATVVIDRPPHNHVNAVLVNALADVFEELGRIFCGGADLTGDRPLSDENGASETPALHRGAYRLFAARRPVVVAVQGAAVGAGLGLALVGDFRAAAPEARFSANFVTLGFHAGFGVTAALPRVVGEQHASLMPQTGRRVKAEDALRYGLVDEITPLADLRAAAQRRAGEIAVNAPLAVEATRATLRGDLAEAVRARTEPERAERTG